MSSIYDTLKGLAVTKAQTSTPAETYTAIQKRLDKTRGALVGLACGDALGTTLEFCKRAKIRNQHTEITGGGFFKVMPGEWTDDTAMALCLAASLIEKKGFDSVDQLERYVQWMQQGYQSCQGECIDIGGTTAKALGRFMQHGMPYAGSLDAYTSGNGGIMRLAPAVLAAGNYGSAVIMAIDSSRTTHASPDCLDSAELLGHVLWQLLQGADLHSLLEDIPYFISRDTSIKRIQMGYFQILKREDVRSTGYVINTLEAALWSCYHSNTFEGALINAVNLGGDADSIGAVTGQIAGAAYGMKAIPERWLETLKWRSRLMGYAEGLFSLRLGTQ